MHVDGYDRSQQVDFERITFFYSNFWVGILGMTMATLGLGIVVARLYAPFLALFWGAAVLIAYVPRLLISVRFGRMLKEGVITPENISPWERYSTYASIAPFLIYSCAVFFPYGSQTELALLYCAVFSLMLIAGGSLSYSTAVGVLLVFLHFVMLSLIARSIWEGGTLLYTLAAFLSVGYLMLMRMIMRVHKAMVENIKLKLHSRHESLIDPLTQLWNRRRLYLFLDQLIPASERSGHPFSVVLMDLDHFKEFNDSRGHQAGDEILVVVAGLIQECARKQDLVVRYGGEEFMLVLPDTNLDQARLMAARVIGRIRDNAAVTISAGLCEYQQGMDEDSLVKQADDALYAAKKAGRDTYRAAAP